MKLALGVALIASATAAHGHGSDVPAHRVRGVECVALPPGPFAGQKQVRVSPPAVVSPWYNVSHYSQAEQVSWRPSLYRWEADRNAYVLYREAGFTSAFVTTAGFYGKGWISKANAGQMLFFPFHVPAGYYAVLHRIYWHSSDTSHDEWAPNVCNLQ